MKRTAHRLFVLISAFFLAGCLPSALLPVMTAGTVYQGYESVSALKNVQGKDCFLKGYQKAFISADVQPRKENASAMNTAMERAYSRTVNAMARELGLELVCRPYDSSEVARAPDALIIQVEELKSSLLGKLASGGKMKISVKYIDRKTARCLDEEVFKISKDYQDVVGVVSLSSMLKMSGEKGGSISTAGVIRALMENRNKYPVLTARERELLSKG